MGRVAGREADRPGTLPAGPGPRGLPLGGSDAWCPLVRLRHVEYPGRLDGDNLRRAVAGAHDRGDDLGALLTLPDHATGFQPGMESAHVGCAGALREDAGL